MVQLGSQEWFILHRRSRAITSANREFPYLTLMNSRDFCSRRMMHPSNKEIDHETEP